MFERNKFIGPADIGVHLAPCQSGARSLRAVTEAMEPSFSIQLHGPTYVKDTLNMGHAFNQTIMAKLRNERFVTRSELNVLAMEQQKSFHTSVRGVEHLLLQLTECRALERSRRR